MSFVPAYTEIHDRLQAIIDNPLKLSPHTLTNALNDASIHLSIAEMQVSLASEITKLFNSFVQIERSFQANGDLLDQLRTDGSLQIDRGAAIYEDALCRRRKVFGDALRLSFLFAAQGEIAADDFADLSVFLANECVPMWRRQKAIHTYLEKTMENNEIYWRLSDEWSKLRTQVRTESSPLWGTLIRNNSLDSLSMKLGEHKSSLSDIMATMNDLIIKLKAFAVALDVLPIAAGTLDTLGVLCPISTINLLLSFLWAVIPPTLLMKIMDEKRQIETEFQCYWRLRTITKDLKEAASSTHVQYPSAEVPKESDWNHAVKTIDALQSSRSSFLADLQAISSDLLARSDSEGLDHSKLLKARLDAAGRLYVTASEALRRYQLESRLYDFSQAVHHVPMFGST